MSSLDNGRPKSTYIRCWSRLQVTTYATSLCPPQPLEIWSCQRFWMLGHMLQYTNARHKKLSVIQEKQGNACRLRCQRDDENHSWKGNKKKYAIQSEFGGNYQLLLGFSCERDKDVFSSWLTMVGHWCAEISYLEVFQTNRSGKENDLEINGLWCPNLRPKDLILIWATSEGNNHWCQTPKHTPIYELFIHLGAGGKVGWANSGWGYPGSLLQADQEYFWV